MSGITVQDMLRGVIDILDRGGPGSREKADWRLQDALKQLRGQKLGSSPSGGVAPMIRSPEFSKQDRPDR